MIECDSLINVWFELTNSCNFKCRFCYNEFDRLESNSKINPQKFQQVLSVIKEKFSINMITLSGGEPLIRKDIYQFVKIAAKFCSSVILASNGYLFNRIDLQKLVHAGCRNVQISILADNNYDFDYISKSKGSFEKVLKGIIRLKTLEVEVVFVFVLTRDNFKSLRGVIEIASLLSVSSIIINQERLTPFQLLSMTSTDILQKKKDFLKTVSKLDEYAARLGVSLILATYIPFKYFTNTNFNSIEIPKNNMNRIIVDSYGRIKLCAASTKSLENIYNSNFSEIFKKINFSQEKHCPCSIEESKVKYC